MDSNHLLSKPEFCLFMYLMHALRNFGASFHLPEHITPTQAAKILGLEGMVRGAGGSAGAPQVGPSSQGYNPAQAHSGNGGLQGTQQYPQQEPQQIGANDWEATGGMSPSQQQAVQEMTALGFSAQQSQVWLLCSPAFLLRVTCLCQLLLSIFIMNLIVNFRFTFHCQFPLSQHVHEVSMPSYHPALECSLFGHGSASLYRLPSCYICTYHNLLHNHRK